MNQDKSEMKVAVLVLDNIRSVENTGSIFRTAEGLGVSKIHLVGTTPAPLDRFNRKRADFAKVALGAEDMVPWEQHDATPPILKKLKEEGYEIIALEQTDGSSPIKYFKSQDKFALVVGNEVTGVSPETLTHVDKTVEIPMQGNKESLNVAVATGIALYVLS